MSTSHAKYYLYTSSAPASPSLSPASTSSPSSASQPSSSSPLAHPSVMLSVVYPSQMYVAQPQQQKAYYVQPQVVAPAAGQWATATGGQWVSVSPSTLAGGNYVYATTSPQPQHQPQQRPAMATVVPPGYALATVQPRARAPSTYGAQPRPIPAPIRSQSYPPTVAPQPRPLMQRKMSSVSLRRGSFDDQEGIIPDADDMPVPASPVLSEATSSSSGSSSGSSGHLNLSRSAMNHYTSPQRSRRLSVGGRGFDPLANRSQLSLPPPPIQPQQIVAPPISSGPLLSTPPQPQPNFVRPSSNSTRPVSFHEDSAPVYSSYELYQPPPGSRPPTIRPSLGRRASSRSLGGGVPELGPGSYGASLGMGGPSMGMYGGADYGSKGKWWKGGR